MLHTAHLCDLGQLCANSLHNWSRAENRASHFHYLTLAAQYLEQQPDDRVWDDAISIDDWASALGLNNAYSANGVPSATLRHWVKHGLLRRAKVLLLGFQRHLLAMLAAGVGVTVSDDDQWRQLTAVSPAQLITLYLADEEALILLLRRTT
jgi:hypothetical protein